MATRYTGGLPEAIPADFAPIIRGGDKVVKVSQRVFAIGLGALLSIVIWLRRQGLRLFVVHGGREALACGSNITQRRQMLCRAAEVGEAVAACGQGPDSYTSNGAGHQETCQPHPRRGYAIAAAGSASGTPRITAMESRSAVLKIEGGRYEQLGGCSPWLCMGSFGHLRRFTGLSLSAPPCWCVNDRQDRHCVVDHQKVWETTVHDGCSLLPQSVQ